MNPPLNTRLITDSVGLKLVEDFLRRNQVYCFDVETNVADKFYQRYCRLIQIGNRDEQYAIDLLAFSNWDKEELMAKQGNFINSYPEISAILQPSLESRNWLKVGVNLEFDYMVARWNLGWRPYNFFDCQLAEKKLYCGAVDLFASGFWGLKPLVERYLKLQISKEFQTSFDLETPITPGQLVYAGLDVRLPMAIKSAQYQLLAKANLLNAATIEFNAIPASGDIQLNGMLCDTQKWMDLVNLNQTRKAEVVEKLDKHFIPVVGRKCVPQEDLDALEKIWKDTPNKTPEDKLLRATRREAWQSASSARTQWNKESPNWEGEAALNYKSPLQLLKAMRLLGYKESKLKDTSDETLKEHAGDPIVDLIRDYRTYNTLLDKFGVEWLRNAVDPVTGRVHQKFNQFGAETGRASSSNPNMQQIPAQYEDGIYRKCFVARPGHKLIILDYAGQELRILAEYSQDPIWLKAFKDGWDLHSLGAEMLYGDKWKVDNKPECKWVQSHGKCDKKVCPTHAKLRNNVKSINFGLAYGMGPNKLAKELGITKKEAQQLLDDYKKAFPVVMKYLDISGKRAATKLEARTLGQSRRLFNKPTWEQATQMARNKLKREPNSREISKQYNVIYGAIEREGKNTPIQGSAAEMFKIAMGCGFDANGKPYLWHYLHKLGAYIVNVVHDEIVLEAPIEIADKIAQIAGDCMLRAGAELVKTVVMEYEAHVSDYWEK